MESKVSYEQAEVELLGFFEKRKSKVIDLDSEAGEKMKELIIEYIMDGVIEITDGGIGMTQNLMFPVKKESGENHLEKIEFKSRIRASERFEVERSFSKKMSEIDKELKLACITCKGMTPSKIGLMEMADLTVFNIVHQLFLQ